MSGSSSAFCRRLTAALAVAWWIALVLRGLLPAVFAIAMGILVNAAQRGEKPRRTADDCGCVFVLLQVLSPVHHAISASLGDRAAACFMTGLPRLAFGHRGWGISTDAKLATDLTVARDFDQGMTGPPLSISMDFIAGGLVQMITGVACVAVLFGYRWWAPLLRAARGCPPIGCCARARLA